MRWQASPRLLLRSAAIGWRKARHRKRAVTMCTGAWTKRFDVIEHLRPKRSAESGASALRQVFRARQRKQDGGQNAIAQRIGDLRAISACLV